MIKPSTIQCICCVGVVLLIASPFILLGAYLEEEQKYQDLVLLEGTLKRVEVKTPWHRAASSKTVWLTVANAHGKFNACVSHRWSALETLRKGSSIKIRGYDSGPCGIRAAEIIENGRVVVSHEEYIKNLERGISGLIIMSIVSFVIGLVTFFVYLYLKPERKMFR